MKKDKKIAPSTERVINYFGGASTLKSVLNPTFTALYQWANRRIPKKYYRALREVSGGELTPCYIEKGGRLAVVDKEGVKINIDLISIKLLFLLGGGELDSLDSDNFCTCFYDNKELNAILRNLLLKEAGKNEQFRKIIRKLVYD